MLRILSVATALLSVVYGGPLLSPRWSMPIVDLGYELHQAISYNEAVGYYNFSNVCGITKIGLYMSYETDMCRSRSPPPQSES